MTSTTWLAGLLPLLAFALADMFFGFKTGLIAAFILALAEAIWTWVTFGQLDQISALSLILITGMGLLAWKKNSPILFKLQPSIISLFLASWLIISWSSGDPLFVAMTHKYSSFLPDIMRANLKNPYYIHYLEQATLTTGIGLVVHALVTAWAAWKLPTWWWIAVRGIGFYVFCFVGMFLARFII